MIGTKCLANFNTAQAGKHQVEQNYIRVFLAGAHQAFTAITCDKNLKTFGNQVVAQCFPKGAVILNDEDFLFAARSILIR